MKIEIDLDCLTDLIYKILTEEFYLGVAMSSNIRNAINKKLTEYLDNNYLEFSEDELESDR